MRTKDEYLKGIAKTKRGQMERRLLRWGGTMEFCKRKQEEVKKREKEARTFLELGEGSPFLGKSVVFLEEARQLYEEMIGELTESIKGELKAYQEVQKLVEQLEYEEQKFVELRYEKGYFYDAIALKTNTSRATCFRMKDSILDKLIALAEEVETF